MFGRPHRVKDSLGSMRFSNRKHDVGVVVGLPSRSTARVSVVFKNLYATCSGDKIVWATYTWTGAAT